MIKLFFSSLVLCTLWSGVTSAEIYEFTLTNQPDKAADRPKVRAIDDLVINGTIHLHAYQLTVLDVNDKSGWSTAAPETLKMQVHLDPKFAGRLAAYYRPEGWILVPRDWKVTGGAKGGDGSAYIDFAPLKGRGHLTYTTAGLCAGCAASTAAVFFPEARRREKQLEPLFYTGTNVPLKTVRVRPKMMAYHAVVDRQPIDGLAFYDEEPDPWFFKVEVSLPDGERDLATPILNWFLPPK